jgi:hypothetical protein
MVGELLIKNQKIKRANSGLNYFRHKYTAPCLFMPHACKAFNPALVLC